MAFHNQSYRGNSYYPYAKPPKQKPAWQLISEENVLGRLRLKSTFLWEEPAADYVGLRHCYISHPMSRGEANKMEQQMRDQGLETRVVVYEQSHALAVTRDNASAWVKSPSLKSDRSR